MVVTLNTDRNRERTPRAVSSNTWEEFIRVFPIYAALTRQCELPAGPYPAGAKPQPWPDKKTRERDLVWMDEVDRRVEAVHLRQFLATPGVAREEGLRVFLNRQLLKPDKQVYDRDKIDLLIVQYFVLCAPQELIEGNIEFEDVAKILKPLLGEVEPATLECCEPLDRLMEAAQQCNTLRDMVEQGLLEQGRIAKEEAGGMFYDPVALVSICRFNFVLRRTFIQLLHADLRVIGAALNDLERRGRKQIDCRRAGLSATEPIEELRQFHHDWKMPFRTDYKKDTAFRPYEQLMCLREDLEEALGVKPPTSAPKSAVDAAKSSPRPAATKPVPPKKVVNSPDKTSPPAAPSGTKSGAPPVKAPASQTPVAQQPPRATTKPAPKDSIPSPEQKAPAITAADLETLEEKIWEQLIATPPVRGRSMTTVTVEETRVLLSAWEVAAFISASGKDSDDLRRVIAARALLSTAIERRKKVLDFKTLHQSIAHARKEIPRFQERIDQLKRTAKTDSAVNLGISLKRLLSLIDEAEQLQKGSSAQEEK
jgi:hypothetical protein